MKIGLVDDDGGCPELEAYCRSSVPSGLSLLALDDDDTLVGVILNEVIEREAVPAPEEAEVRADSTKFDKILAVNHAAERAMDIFAAYPAEPRALDVKILATDPSRTKQGIAAALMERTK